MDPIEASGYDSYSIEIIASPDLSLASCLIAPGVLCFIHPSLPLLSLSYRGLDIMSNDVPNSVQDAVLKKSVYDASSSEPVKG